MRITLFAIIGVTLLATSTQALYDKSGPVLELTAQNFKEEVMNNGHLVAVEFYAPWCGHCQRLAPAWKKAAGNLNGLVKVGAVDCDQDSNKPLCSQYGIQGFPTIKLFAPSSDPTKKATKRPTDYQGPREAKPIVDHLLAIQPSNVRFVKGDASQVKSKKSISLDNFLETDNSTMPKALLFTDKPTTTPLYKALSVDFVDRMLFGEVKKSVKEAVESFGISNFPTLVVLTPDSGAVEYSGKLKKNALEEFLNQHALPASEKSKEKNKSKVKKEKSKKREDDTFSESETAAFDPKVANLNTDKDLDEQCLSKSGICVIAVLPAVDPEDEQSPKEQADALHILEEVKRLDHENNGNLSPFLFQWVDANIGKSIVNKFDMSQDYPTLVVVKPTKKVYRPFVGAWNENSIKTWLDIVAAGRFAVWDYKGDLKLSPMEKSPRDEL
ncbi:hypothetical protein VKS41_005474 [Umbelopsis sp. WA50703]